MAANPLSFGRLSKGRGQERWVEEVAGAFHFIQVPLWGTPSSLEKRVWGMGASFLSNLALCALRLHLDHR